MFLVEFLGNHGIKKTSIRNRFWKSISHWSKRKCPGAGIRSALPTWSWRQCPKYHRSRKLSCHQVMGRQAKPGEPVSHTAKVSAYKRGVKIGEFKLQRFWVSNLNCSIKIAIFGGVHPQFSPKQTSSFRAVAVSATITIGSGMGSWHFRSARSFSMSISAVLCACWHTSITNLVFDI